MAEDATPPIQSVIDTFKWRARRRQLGAYGFLLLMAAGIGAATYVFIQAKEITDRETTADIDTKISQEQKRIDDENVKILETQQSLDASFEKMLQELSIEQKDNCKKVIPFYDPTDYTLEFFFFDNNKRLRSKSEFVRALLANVNNTKFPADCAFISILRRISQTATNSSEIIFNIEGLKQVQLQVWSSSNPSTVYRDLDKLRHHSVIAHKSLKDLNDHLERQEISTETGEPDAEGTSSTLSLPFLLQLNITRFGTVTLVAIAIGILVSLYRFSARLAAFYQSRADILIMHQITGYKRTGIEQLSSIFTPTFDFGKSQTIPDNLTELIRAALAHGKGAE
jgi:hypothetical protein